MIVLERLCPVLSTSDEMVLIPAGPFLMGSDGRVDEQPAHRVVLPDYYISKYPVTNIQFARFVKVTGYITDAERAGAQFTWRHPLGVRDGILERMDRPVAYLTWHDAQAYALAVGKRLPTEAEWEKAARGTDGRRYPWGNDMDVGRANLWKGKRLEATPVWLYAAGASPYGVLDMVGNLPEWCSSLYRPYPYDPADGREDAQVEGQRVVRSGSWYEHRCAVRTYYDGGMGRTGHAFRIGLRLAMSVAPDNVAT